MERLADRIRRMSDDELAAFLFVHQVKSLSGFMTNGGAGCRDMIDMKKWMKEPAPDDKELLTLGGDEE